MSNNDVFLNIQPLPVLTPKEEKELLAKKEEAEAMEVLVTHNLRLILYIIKRYQNTKIDPEDLFSIGIIGLIKAIRSYNIEKNAKLGTYAARCIENEILMYIRQNKKHNGNRHLSEVIHTNQDGEELKLEDVISIEDTTMEIEDKLEMLEMLSNTMTSALNKLGSREKIILLLKMGGKTQREISKQFNLTQSYISRVQGKTNKKMKIFAQKGINKDTHFKFIFQFTEYDYEFGISLEEYPDLKKKLSEFEKTLSGISKEIYNAVPKEIKGSYIFWIFPMWEGSFIFISEMIKWFDKLTVKSN